MVDYIGILPDNNGGFLDAWDIYQGWNNYALRPDVDNMWEERESYFRLKGFREKLSKPTNRISFLGLFDAVVVKSKYLGREGERISTSTEISKSASTICHAISIDECQAELHPVLLNEELSEGLHMKGIKQVWFPGSHAVSILFVYEHFLFFSFLSFSFLFFWVLTSTGHWGARTTRLR